MIPFTLIYNEDESLKICLNSIALGLKELSLQNFQNCEMGNVLKYHKARISKSALDFFNILKLFFLVGHSSTTPVRIHW